jgi:hypothetical protein
VADQVEHRLGEERRRQGHEDQHRVQGSAQEARLVTGVQGDQLGQPAGAQQDADGARVVPVEAAQPCRQGAAADLGDHGQHGHHQQGEPARPVDALQRDRLTGDHEEERQQQRTDVVQRPDQVRIERAALLARHHHPRQQRTEDHMQPQRVRHPRRAQREPDEQRQPQRGLQPDPPQQPPQQGPRHDYHQRDEADGEQRPPRPAERLLVPAVEQRSREHRPADHVEQPGRGHRDHAGNGRCQPVLPDDGGQDRHGRYRQRDPGEDHHGRRELPGHAEPVQPVLEQQRAAAAHRHRHHERRQRGDHRRTRAVAEQLQIQLVTDREQEHHERELREPGQRRLDRVGEQGVVRLRRQRAQQGGPEGDARRQLPDDVRLFQAPGEPAPGVGGHQDQGRGTYEMRDQRVRAHGVSPVSGGRRRGRTCVNFPRILPT